MKGAFSTDAITEVDNKLEHPDSQEEDLASEEFESISDDGSAESYDTARYEHDLKQYYNNGDFFHVISMARSLNLISCSSPSVHFYISLTLFKLGRIAGALREISLAIENEPSPMIREYIITNLIDFFKEIGMNDKAVACFAEIIAMAKIEAKRHEEDSEKFIEIMGKTRDYESRSSAINIEGEQNNR